MAMFLDIDGNRVFTLSFGSGPRTLLAHSGWIGNFEDWIATLAPLSETWRTVVYDHRGAGETNVSADKISHEALVADVFRVMDSLGIEKCVMAGFSRGTVTALRAVVQRPERFDGLILMNGSADVLLPGASQPQRVAPAAWPGSNFAERLRWFAERCTPEPDSEHIRRWAVNILSRSTPEVADRIFMMQAEEQIDWAKILPKVGLPTLLIHGERDVFCQTETMKFIESLIPDSKLVVMEGAGHLPAMACPLEVAKIIDEFFNARRKT